MSTSTHTITDIAGPIENAMEEVDEDYNCNAFLCRGYQLEDNLDKVLTFAPGDELDIHIDIIAGHKPGYAVSYKSACPASEQQQC